MTCNGFASRLFRLQNCLWWAALLAAYGLFAGLGWTQPGLVGLGVILLCFFCELMDSSLGMGYGTTLTPVLLACGYEPLQLVPTIIISELLTGFAASAFHAEAGNVDFTGRSRHRQVAVILAAGSLLSVPFSATAVRHLNERRLKQTIAFFTLILGSFTLVRALG